jgi:proteasome alpha subunit
MGYDRTIVIFSPDGRLFQVEYAKEAARRGVTALGIIYRNGVLLATPKHLTPLAVPATSEKIFRIDDHVGATAAGLLADARVLTDIARVRAQIHRITYEEAIDVWELARIIGNRVQLSTMYAGLRPFGIIYLMAGFDANPHLIEVDTSGMLYGWLACAIGRGAEEANKILKERWHKDMSCRDAVKLANDVLRRVEKKVPEIEVAVIERKKPFLRLGSERVKEFLK